MTWLNGISTEWAGAIWRGCWQGAILAAVLWIVCRCLPRIPSTVRYWLWWIACAKFVFGALVAPAIPLAVLPSMAPHRLAAPIALPAAVAFEAGPAPSMSTVAPISAAGSIPISVSLTQAAPLSTKPSAVSILLLLWTTVVLVLAWAAARRSIVLMGIVRRARPAGDVVGHILESLSASSTRALVTDEIDGVCVVGVLRPVLLVPSTYSNSMTAAELEMAIAHEVAHLRRLDLWLDLIPAAASTLFFFLPPARFAARVCAQAREEACDAAAVKAAGCDFADYAGMLLKAAGSEPAGAMGVSPAYRQLRARLTGLAASSKSVPRVVRIVAAFALSVALLSMAPWRLMARAARTAASSMAGAMRYQIVDLGPITGADTSHFQINDLGQVIGTSGGRPFLWQSGKMQTVGTLWYHNGRGGGINNAGVYAVTCYSEAGNPHAFYNDNREHLLKGLRGYRFTIARSVNDNGWIVGSAQHSGSDWGAEISRAVLISGGRTHDLGTLGGEHSAAYAVNAAGDIVGKADLAAVDGAHSTHAFLWRSGGMQDLGTLGGADSFAYAVNDGGEVAGFSLVPGDSVRHACVWRTTVNGSSCVDLGALPGDAASEAHGVNDDGAVVGTSDVTGGGASNRAVIWDGSQAVDLNAVADTAGGWRLVDAMAVNNRGAIVGKGTLDGAPHAFVLEPMPAAAGEAYNAWTGGTPIPRYDGLIDAGAVRR